VPASLSLAGAGWIAGVHAFAASQLDGVEVTHVASRSVDRTRNMARRLGALACSYDELPAGADGVVVCTPPSCHAADALQAVDAGAGVLVEKPLCTTLADADRLVDAAAAGACIGYAENLAFAPPVRVALEQARALGTLGHVEVRAVQPRPDWGDFLTAAWGGGVLFDLGAHPIAVALLLAAPASPTRVEAVLGGADDHPVDEHAEVRLEFGGGPTATVVASWRGLDDAVWDALAASGSGVVRLELLPDVRVERDGEDLAVPPVQAGHHPQLVQLGYLDQLADFTRALSAGQPPTLGPAFGRSVLDVIAGAYASAATGGPVDLPFRGSRHRSPHELWAG
jgi:myo-inositol 2-dehydrogenase / D-chiro-inositol 1-dehydrogenase